MRCVRAVPSRQKRADTARHLLFASSSRTPPANAERQRAIELWTIIQKRFLLLSIRSFIFFCPSFCLTFRFPFFLFHTS